MTIQDQVKAQINELLPLAKDGDNFAVFSMLELIRDHLMNRRISRYLSKNRQVDNDDIKQEFMIGVSFAINKVALDIGDPIEYLINMGLYRVRNYMRKHILQGTTQTCKDCGATTRLNRIGNEYICKKCGSTHIETQELEDHDEITLETIPDVSFEDDVISSMMIDGFRDTLDPNTNLYSLFQLLESGVDRDNPAVKNYIAEIAKMWGGCSNQNVVRNLKKLQERFKAWLDDNGYDLGIMYGEE